MIYLKISADNSTKRHGSPPSLSDSDDEGSEALSVLFLLSQLFGLASMRKLSFKAFHCLSLFAVVSSLDLGRTKSKNEPVEYRLINFILLCFRLCCFHFYFN